MPNLTDEILGREVVDVPLTKLKTFPGNPNKGNVSGIADSLREHGQFRPIIVQKSTSFVLGGNHTYMAAKEVGWKTIKAVFLDVDDEAEAKRIVIADNKYAQMAETNDEALAALLASLPDATGTGYSEQERNALISIVEDAAAQAASEVLDSNIDALVGDFDDPLVGNPTLNPAEEDGKEPQPFLDAPDELKGPYQLSDDIDIPTATEWNIPVLRQDMMIEDLPTNLQSWAGSATRDIDDDTIWWLYNFGVDSTSGMKDVSKMILSFYAWDEYFENWWWSTTKYMSRALNSGVQMAVCPNFSQGGLPKVQALWNFYRSRYLGRYFQEVGIRVMPDLEMVHNKTFYSINTACLPKRVPWASIQVQNLTGSTKTGNRATSEDVERWKSEMLACFQSTNPENLLVYGNDNGFEMISDLKLPVDEMRFITSRVSKLAEKAKGRAAKSTL